jgi:Tfp pilus assembly protein PilZ
MTVEKQTAHDSISPESDDAAPISRHDPEAHPHTAAPDPTGRREFVRTVIDLPVEIPTSEAKYLGQTENLSPGGAFVRSAFVIATGERIDLVITMPNASQVTAHGIVRWVREAHPTNPGPGMGIQFLQMEGMGHFVNKKHA